MNSSKDFTRGVFYSKKSEQNYTLTRHEPSLSLSQIVETFWNVEWALRSGQSHDQRNIPDPCINMVFDTQGARVVGAVTRTFSVRLSGEGKIFGVKFYPGGFYALTRKSVSVFSNQERSINEFFASFEHDLVLELNNTDDALTKVHCIERFMQPLIPASIDSVIKLTKIIKGIEDDSSILTVEQVSELHGVSIRTLQRLFREQVGVSPKWVIRKYRMREVLSLLEQGETNWQDISNGLGYFDQSHFIRDFKALIGITPTAYINNLRDIGRSSF